VGLQLLAGQGGLDGGGASVHLASATRPPQRVDQLAMGQRSASIWRRGQAEHGHRVPAAGIPTEGGQGCRVEGPQGAADDVGLSLAGPDQLLMAPGQHLDRFGQPRVTLGRPVMMPVGADQIGRIRASPRSELAREMVWRSRLRLAAKGLTATTW
jgi:hypothetical protein